MDSPQIAQRTPIAVTVEAGATYWWCACGRSATQPFCDGSHKGSGIVPVKFTVERSGTEWFCGCKHTGKSPLCDGSHKRLPEASA